MQRVYGDFGLEYSAKLSTRPAEFQGEVATWDHAEAELKKALESAGQGYTINEGDGAFYGPKIDFDVTDAIGRKWQCATIQLDYQMPERFDLKYVGADNTQHRPVVIHRAIFGSFERFIALLIEQAGGAATDGSDRILDQVPQSLHERTPFVFGTAVSETISSGLVDPKEVDIWVVFGGLMGQVGIKGSEVKKYSGATEGPLF